MPSIDLEMTLKEDEEAQKTKLNGLESTRSYNVTEEQYYDGPEWYVMCEQYIVMSNIGLGLAVLVLFLQKCKTKTKTKTAFVLARTRPRQNKQDQDQYQDYYSLGLGLALICKTLAVLVLVLQKMQDCLFFLFDYNI